MKLLFAAMTSCVLLVNPCLVFGSDGLSGSSSSMSGSSSMPGGSTQIQRMPQLEKATPRELPKTTSSAPVAPPAPLPVGQVEASYFYPGSIVYRNGTWVGGDNLLNLSRNIGLYVSIIKPSTDTLEINEEQFLMSAQKIFEKANIVPKIVAIPGQPPLPFFQVQVLLYPVERGYAASCEGRLFESVDLQRVVLEPTGMAYQAVTWQKSSLIVSPKEKIADQLKADIEDIVQSFADRYVAFDNIRNSLKK